MVFFCIFFQKCWRQFFLKIILNEESYYYLYFTTNPLSREILVRKLWAKCSQPIRLQNSFKCIISRKKWKIKLIFLHIDEHKVSYKLTLLFLVGVVRHLHRTRCKICSKLTLKTPERRQWRRFGVFNVNFEDISRLLLFLLLTLRR